MDVFDRLRLGQRQQVIVALQAALAGMKTIAAEMRLVETQALDLGAHRPVEQQDALARGVAGSAVSWHPRAARGGVFDVRIKETNSFPRPAQVVLAH